MTEIFEGHDDDLPCCPDGTEPFPDFSAPDPEEFFGDELCCYLTQAELNELTYGKDYDKTVILPIEEGKVLQRIAQAKKEVADNFIKRFDIKIKK